jgi:hypothetical protein
MHRILSLNLALRPVDVAAGTTPQTSEGKQTKSLVVPECGCYPDYHVYNSHELRIRGFVKWLRSLPSTLQPNILCFQELMWLPCTEYLSAELEKLGYTTGIDIDPLCPKNQGTTIGISETQKFKRAGSGLAIYYKDNQFELVSCGTEMFNDRLGADYLCEKGYLWAVLKDVLRKVTFAVLTLHPQAYVKISAHSPPCENKMVTQLRQVAVQQMNKMGGYPKCIAMVHQSQFAQIAKTLLLLQSLTSNIIITGDFNVNSFQAEAGSKEEQHPDTAKLGENKNREFLQVLSILNAQTVPFAKCADDSKKVCFTWDPASNEFAKSLDSKSPSVYQKIDHTVVLPNHKFMYIDQQIVPLPLRPFPELDLFWSEVCKEVRRGDPNNDINKIMNQRLMIGMMQRKHAMENASEEQKTNPQAWMSYILSLPFSESSQLWKGLEFYQFQTTPTPTASVDFGVQQFQGHRDLQYKIGDPHPFPMYNQVSDHTGLMTRFSFAL